MSKIRHLSSNREFDNLSESISKRNYSANILAKTTHRKFKIKNIDSSSNREGYKNRDNSKNNIIWENSEELSKNTLKPNNLEKFLFLNQQLKENDNKKKNSSTMRKITSAEPNILKTKLSQKMVKILNGNNHINSASSTSNNNPNKININYNLMNLQLNNRFQGLNSLKKNPFLNNNKNKSNNYNSNLIGTGANNIFFNNKNNMTYNTKIPPIIISKINDQNLEFKKKFKQNIALTKNVFKLYNEYYLKLLQNSRDNMEDFHLIEEKFNNKEDQAIFALFDGHGGIDIAQKLKNEMSQKFKKLLAKQNDFLSTDVILKNLFISLDEEIIEQFKENIEFESSNFKSLGSTCTFLYMLKEGKDRVFYCANLGDTKGLLLTKSNSIKITYDHKPSDESENKRIKNNGGVIFGGRIFGQFSLTRAFGNIPLKKWVIAEPYIRRQVLNENDRFIVLASDGIWDVITDEECYEISMRHNQSKSFCEDLVNIAISRWSKDNISCIIVKVGT